MSGEDDFIRRHFAPLAGPGALDLRDDAALVTPPAGTDLVLTTDAVVAGVHFLPDDPPDDIARKALRVNLSDLAAKGAAPLGFLLTLALPRAIDDDYVARFAKGLADDARIYACPLLGGDTVATPGPLTVSVTAFGSVPSGGMVRRDGAGAGDFLYVTGTIGDAALGLLVVTGDARLKGLSPAHRDHLAGRYRRPQPRTALSAAVRDHACAAMDISDGLAGDMTKMLGLAGLSARIDISGIPLSSAAAEALRHAPELRERVLTGGDDYELLSAVPPSSAVAFETAATKSSIPVTRIGVAGDEDGIAFFDEGGRAISLGRLSYSHR